MNFEVLLDREFKKVNIFGPLLRASMFLHKQHKRIRTSKLKSYQLLDIAFIVILL